MSLVRPKEPTEAIVERYLSECFAIEDVPRASELAARCGMSPAQLTRAFVRELGSRPAEFLKGRQVDCAKRLLETTTLTTTEIAYRAGFGTRGTFFRVFRRATGMTPAQYRARIHPEAA
ncbi:MAG TPA: AraC family transcriptional regulator [Thermoanaerobaculia bacterium]|jgi:AraC-like DNA-binding protein|nr:AraC family transcriptional regulator [Thermoanaerobaculia bacterium]